MDEHNQFLAKKLGERFGKSLIGVRDVTIYLLLDWILPTWLKKIYCVLLHLVCARTIDTLVQETNSSTLARGASQAVWLLAGWIFLSAVLPERRYLLVYSGLFGHGLASFLRWLAWMTSDHASKGYEEWIESRNTVIVFWLMAFILLRPATLGSMIWNALLYVMVPLASTIAAVIAVQRTFPHNLKIQRIRMRMGKSIGWLLLSAIDCPPVWEAFVVEHIPKTVQRWWSRLLQRTSLRRSIPIYKYRPLNEDEIRLLVLKRTNPILPRTIRATIIHVPISDNVDYEAVSYRWGSSVLTDEIMVDGARLLITTSAFELLLARRTIWKERVIWIDAICINQNDDSEKAAQVQLMREIYSRASRVVVFLGAQWRYRLAVVELWARIISVHTQQPHKSKENPSPHWRAAIDLLTNEYFKRTWIIQEIVLGKQVELFFGGYYFPWEACFILAAGYFNEDHRNMDLHAPNEKRISVHAVTFDNIEIISRLKHGFESPDQGLLGSKLDNLIIAALKFNTSDPRDKVFGILGLAQFDQTNERLKVDYTKSSDRLFQDIAIYSYIEQENPSIYLLALAGTGYGRDSRTLPSWAPDLSEKRLNYPFVDPTVRKEHFYAGGDTVPEVRMGVHDDSIQVTGIMIDTILAVSAGGALNDNTQPGEVYDPTVMAKLKGNFAVAAEDLVIAHSEQVLKNYQDLKEGLGRTLIVDRCNNTSPAPVKVCKTYSDWSWIARGFVGNREIDDWSLILDGPPTLMTAVNDGSLHLYDESLIRGCGGRSFGICESGRLCVVPPLIKKGDRVFIPHGAQTPYLLRRKEREEGAYEVVGEAYVDGVMYGEAMGSVEAQAVLLQ